MIERMEFGRTGHASSRVIYGGAGLGRVDENGADELLMTLREFGINHIDTAPAYRDSEVRIAPWMARHREEFFLATKTDQRSGHAARAQLEASLTRLGVDHVDLIQLHNLVEQDDWEIALGPGGALEALERAREEGLARFIGVTGHGLRIASVHLRSLERFDFDSVLLPFNFTLMSDEAYRRDFERVVEVCSERRVAVQTIKSLARRRWIGDEGPRFSWYEPLRAGEPLRRAVHWVLTTPGVFLNTSSDTRLLRPTLEAASLPPRRPSDEEMLHDVEALGMRPLFDGAALERI